MHVDIGTPTDIHVNLLLSSEWNGREQEGTTGEEKVARVTFFPIFKLWEKTHKIDHLNHFSVYSSAVLS